MTRRGVPPPFRSAAGMWAVVHLAGALAVVAVLWIAATLVTRAGDGSIEGGADLAAFFEGVDAASVDEARILRPADSIRLMRQGDAWQVNGFRADSGAVARFFRPGYQANIVDKWLPALDGVIEKLERGARAADGAVEIEVVDRGCGIAPSDLERVFDAFVSLRPGGNGLGLTISRQIVEQLGGTLVLESAPGRGTRARLRLPSAGAS